MATYVEWKRDKEDEVVTVELPVGLTMMEEAAIARGLRDLEGIRQVRLYRVKFETIEVNF